MARKGACQTQPFISTRASAIKLASLGGHSRMRILQCIDNEAQVAVEPREIGRKGKIPGNSPLL